MPKRRKGIEPDLLETLKKDTKLSLQGSDRAKLAYVLGATFDYQQNIINCTDQYRTVRKARQVGMTTAFAIETLIDALTYDDYVMCIISPTQRQSDRFMRYIRRALRLLEKYTGALVPTEKFTNSEIIFHHGSEINSLPNNPQGVQGIDANDVKIDEAGLFMGQEGDAIIDAVVGSLAAKKGKLTISGKPRGKRGLLWEYWDKEGEKYNSFSHFVITGEDRARQDPSYGIEMAKHRKILTKLQYDETYNAEFVDEGVLIYPYEFIEAAVNLWKSNNFVLMPPDGKPMDNLPRYIGIDFGRKRNLTEIHVLQKEKELLRTLCMKSMRDTNFEVQKEQIDLMIARVKPRIVEIDERGMGLPLLDYLTVKYGKSMIRPLQFSMGKTKEKTVLQLRNVLVDLKLAFPHEDSLINQLHSFQKEYTEAGNVRYFGKIDETDFLDDKVVALIAAVDAAMGSSFEFSIV